MILVIISLIRLTDNLPAATKYELLDSKEVQYEIGYKLGFVSEDKVGDPFCAPKTSWYT